jgi:hypothetical protein
MLEEHAFDVLLYGRQTSGGRTWSEDNVRKSSEPYPHLLGCSGVSTPGHRSYIVRVTLCNLFLAWLICAEVIFELVPSSIVPGVSSGASTDDAQ